MKIDHGLGLNKEVARSPVKPNILSWPCAWDFFNKIMNTLNHSIIAIVTFVICWKVFTNATIGIFEMHIGFCAIGYQFLMSETILTLSGENSWTTSLDRTIKKTLHTTLATLSATLVIVGTSFAIYMKSTHFTSPHGILGLTALIFLIPSVINGPMTLFSGLMNKRVKPVYLKMYHTMTTCCSFCIGITTLCTGYNKGWFKSRTSHEMAIVFTVFSCITIFLTLKVPLINLFKQFLGMIQKV